MQAAFSSEQLRAVWDPTCISSIQGHIGLGYALALINKGLVAFWACAQMHNWMNTQEHSRTSFMNSNLPLKPMWYSPWGRATTVTFWPESNISGRYIKGMHVPFQVWFSFFLYSFCFKRKKKLPIHPKSRISQQSLALLAVKYLWEPIFQGKKRHRGTTENARQQKHFVIYYIPLASAQILPC